MFYHESMDMQKFQIPRHWPEDAKAFALEAISETQDLRTALKLALADIISLKATVECSQAEIKELKTKLGTNSSNSNLPPSKDPPSAPTRESKPTGNKQGAQKGHRGAGRSLFPPERVDHVIEVFPSSCPISQKQFSAGELAHFSFKPMQQVDLPAEAIHLRVTETRLYSGPCPCGCGTILSVAMPLSMGNTVIGSKLKAMMALLASRFRLSKRLIQELLVDLFGPDAKFSIGCISEAEAEIADSLKQPYEEAREEIKKAPAVNVDETSWFLKHDLQWLWVAVSNALAVFYIDPKRSRAAFERFIGGFEGFIMSDRFSVYSKLSPEERQLCWAHLIRDFRKLVDRNGGAEGIGEWALKEIEGMFELWHSYLDQKIDKTEMQQRFIVIRARFARLLKIGKETTDPKATKFCENLTKVWPALWNFIKHPDILQPTNNRAEQAVRSPVIARMLSLGSQSERGLRFVERMLTVVTTLRKQGRMILEFLNQALISYRTGGIPPSLLPIPSG